MNCKFLRPHAGMMYTFLMASCSLAIAYILTLFCTTNELGVGFLFALLFSPFLCCCMIIGLTIKVIHNIRLVGVVDYRWVMFCLQLGSMIRIATYVGAVGFIRLMVVDDIITITDVVLTWIAVRYAMGHSNFMTL